MRGAMMAKAMLTINDRAASLAVTARELARRLGREPVFARDGGGVLTWIAAAMAMLAALALGAAFIIDDASARWRQALTGQLTVELPPLAPASDAIAASRTEADRLAAALAVLRDSAGIARAEPLSRARVAALVEPWLGGGIGAAGLPLPQLIDVRLSNDGTIDIAALRERLAGAAPGAIVDDHRSWTDGLVRLANIGLAAAISIVILVAAVAALSVVQATRARLALHREAIELLHLIGATDQYIAREFARDALIVAFFGAVIGVASAAAFGAAVLAGAPDFAIGAPALHLGAIGPGGWLVLSSLPLWTAALALVTAWITARRALRRAL
ncbi:MAG TPA: FtsX-like permease family protein [Alphaproteobacteria bacterium]|nr:FtsX-like permease family protein [Alphaproteobacteria bacterium]